MENLQNEMKNFSVTFKHNCLLENSWNLKWVMNDVIIIGDSVQCEICFVWNSVNHICFYSSVFYLAHIKMYLYVFCLLPQTITESSKCYDVQYVWQTWLLK